MNTKVTIVEGSEVAIQDNLIKIKGPKGEIQREFNQNKLEIKVSGKEVEVIMKNKLKKTKAYAGSMISHIKNMIKGVTEGYLYKLKILYKHFPININVQGSEVVIKNFAGEKVPRVSKILEGVKVNIQGQIIEVSGTDKEKVGQTAANIENKTRITKKDIRRFQDGIFITQKG